MPTCPSKYISSVAGKVLELLSGRDNRIEAHIVGARSPDRADQGVRALIVLYIELFPFESIPTVVLCQRQIGFYA